MKIRLVISLVGMISMVMGCCMLVSMVVSLLYGENKTAMQIALSSLIALVIGAGAFKQYKPREGELGLKEGFGIVGFSWLAASLVGSLPFMLTGSIPNFAMAFFESASGLTTTGSTILSDIEALPKGVLFWRSFTHWLGGMGIIVLSVAILPYLGLGGMQLYKAESPGPTKDKLEPRIQQTAKLLWGVYLLMSLACFLLLWLAGMDVYDAACHTFGTVATGGFSTYNASLGHFTQPLIQYIVIFFMLICGISFALHYRALSGEPKAYLRTAELRFYLLLIFATTFIIYFSRVDAGIPIEQNFRESLFQVVSIITTTGYGTADFEQWKPVAQFSLLALMVVGGCAGSTGGGLKVIRILLLTKYLKISLNQQLHPSGVFVIKLDGVRVKREVIQNILSLGMVFVFIITIATFFLTLYGVDVLTAATATLSCVSNIGPGLGDVGPTENFSSIPTPGIWLLSLCMIMGRLEIFSLLILFMPQTWQR
ncbi:TrkH family potassium uptake protein [Acanthopleuribacter pedis]|uniref:TrkH family potassium uptake protein n=1 Tax=Acanthopleuribacter pedis TaxID=442870 RepID=A0A8J7QD16_9BACT|nr:TrkH family potassium uptake protein [Acanthopleuribacter pedis]MBO1321180.1 TrkH family potassium uptake protein [Acanthopleuribacter pedis]